MLGSYARLGIGLSVICRKGPIRYKNRSIWISENFRQWGCDEREDVLRPYSHLSYAWDEPSLPHRLVLALPGNRVLGVFDLDKASSASLYFNICITTLCALCSLSITWGLVGHSIA